MVFRLSVKDKRGELVYIQCLMEKNGKVLTLGEWPTRPPAHHHHHLSPITKRILSQVHLEPQELLPITYQQFLQKHSHSPHTKVQLEEYKEEANRRKKQVAILAEIRMSYILGKEYGQAQRKQSRAASKRQAEFRSKSREYEAELQNSQGQSASKISRKLSRVGSNKANHLTKSQHRLLPDRPQDQSPTTQRQQSQYFVNFNPKKQKIRVQSNLKQQESTKSNQGRKSNIKIQEQGQYGYMGPANNSKVRSRKASRMRGTRADSSRELCQELLKTVQAWENLDRVQMAELQKMGDLTGKERDRLCKIHSLEKQEIGHRMRVLKRRLKSEPRVM